MRTASISTEKFERRPKTARNSEIDTKTKLLNAAERLFSDKGIEALSHRDIASAAALNLAALNYHFGSRQAFIRAVIKRSVEPINAHRLAALARAERQMSGAPVPTDKILEVFFGPAVEDPSGSFLSSLWIGPDVSPYRGYLIGLTMPVLGRFAGALRRSLPTRSDEDCHWYLCFSLAILAFILAGPRCLSGFSPSFENRMNESVVTERMIKPVCGGLMAKLRSDFVVLRKVMPGCFVGPKKCV
jgi:AcrR family transcriptional regulator